MSTNPKEKEGYSTRPRRAHPPVESNFPNSKFHFDLASARVSATNFRYVESFRFKMVVGLRVEDKLEGVSNF
jgi:hypothetical protein